MNTHKDWMASETFVALACIVIMALALLLVLKDRQDALKQDDEIVEIGGDL